MKELRFSEKDLKDVNKSSNNADPWLTRDITCYEILSIIKKEKEVSPTGMLKKHGIPDRTAGQAMERLKRHGYLTDRYSKEKASNGATRITHLYSLRKGKKTFNLE